jgi:hypothetical protein
MEVTIWQEKRDKTLFKKSQTKNLQFQSQVCASLKIVACNYKEGIQGQDCR